MNPTVTVAHHFYPDKDAAALRKAMKGLGTDETTIIEIICRRTHAQRQLIIQGFSKQFGRDLVKDLKSELSGNFKKVIIGLMMPPVDYICHELNNAMVGIGTDDAALIEILCPRNKHEVSFSTD